MMTAFTFWVTITLKIDDIRLHPRETRIYCTSKGHNGVFYQIMIFHVPHQPLNFNSAMTLETDNIIINIYI